jgi:autotransporter-associated beta strand protein
VPTANSQRFDVGNGNTLSINGILAVIPSQGVQFRIGTTTPGQGFLQPTTDGGEVVLAVARGNNSALTTSSLAISNVIQNFSGGSAGTKVTTESSATMIFQALNTYTGVTTINSGVLRVLRWADAGSASGLGMGSTGATPNAADIVINGGTLNYGNQTANTPARTNRLFTIGPAGATLDNSSNSPNTTNTLAIGQNSDGSSSGSIAFSDSNAPASLTLAHNAPAANQYGTGTLSAVLGDPGTGANVTSLTKTNAGTWILTAANTHSGLTRITGGTLQLGNNLALQNSIFDPSGAGALGFSSGINTPTIGGLTSASNLTMASNVTALTLNPGTGVTTTYSGALGSVTAGMSLTKTGAGTQVLTGVNTYTGATNVNVGTLAITGSGSINAASGITVAAGARLVYNSSTTMMNTLSLSGAGTSSRAILGGAGTIGATVTLDNIGDTLSPGNSPGIQTFTEAQTWSSFSYDWEVNNFTGTTAGTDFDQLGLNALNLTGGPASYTLNVLSLTASNAAGNVPNFSEVNRSWTILTSTTGITGFNAANWSINTTGFADPTTGNWVIAQSGNDLVLSYNVIPEPNVAALIGGLGVLLILRRRR